MDSAIRTSIDPTGDPFEHARSLLEVDAPGLEALAQLVGLGPRSLRRGFIQRYGLSPAQYAAQRRLQALRHRLREGSGVSAALYEAGYGSPSRVYEHASARLGMTPARYREGGAGLAIHFTVIDSSLGPALVAATGRGICAVSLGDSADGLVAGLRGEFPRADIGRVDAGARSFVAPRVEAVARALAGEPAGPVSVELIGTAFQHRVWAALMRVPIGQTRSYRELAVQLGCPGSVRAAAGACARNRVAVLVPCHRIVRSDGGLGGYRWGLPRKSQLLAREQVRSGHTAGAQRQVQDGG